MKISSIFQPKDRSLPMRSSKTDAEIERDAARYQWYHQIQLTQSFTTPGICGFSS